MVYKDLVIFGGRNPETLPAPPGDIRAFDVRTGKLRWSFHTIPRPGEFGYDTWPKDAWKTSGAANNWAGMALDPQRGILYAPTGSAAFDFYGADRLGDDLFANSLLALNALTGERIWHFQAVHHDIWDRDFPSAPALLTVRRAGKEIAAVAQTTKQGFVYLFDRTDGNPLFPIESRKYPPSNVPGEAAASEQPLPTRPAPFARQILTEDLLTTRTPEAHQWAMEKFKTFRRRKQCARHLHEPVQRLPRRKNDRLASRDAFPGRRERSPDSPADHRNRQGRQRPHARFSKPDRRSTVRTHRIPDEWRK
jgi:quinoprotein glucose dehydrogenase